MVDTLLTFQNKLEVAINIVFLVVHSTKKMLFCIDVLLSLKLQQQICGIWQGVSSLV